MMISGLVNQMNEMTIQTRQALERQRARRPGEADLVSSNIEYTMSTKIRSIGKRFRVQDRIHKDKGYSSKQLRTTNTV